MNNHINLLLYSIVDISQLLLIDADVWFIESRSTLIKSNELFIVVVWSWHNQLTIYVRYFTIMLFLNHESISGLNHKNRTILLLFHSCDDSSKCDLNLGRHTLVDKRVFWVCCICWINKDDHFFGYIQRQFAFERHTSVSGTEQFLSVWIYKNLNLGNTKLLFEEPNTDGRQVICHVNKSWISWLKNVKNTWRMFMRI